MGFERTQAEAAIKAARGQIDLAIEYLYSGIPEGIKDMDLDNVQEQEEGENEGNDGGQDDDPVKNVASIAKIICQRDPSGLTSLLQNIQQNDPDLMNLIKQREEEFKTFLEQPITNEDYRVLQRFSQELGLGGLGGEHSHEAGSGSGRGQIRLNLTPEDKEAITRLKSLGNFSEIDVIQAYIACDKNEEMAANYLFEQKMNDDNNNNGN